MTQLSYSQLEQLWIDNGGDPFSAPIAAAIALAESGGHTDSINNNPATGDYSVGLWQINYYGPLMAGRTRMFGPPSQQTDPNANARDAIKISNNGRNFQPWSTYTSGAYRRYLSGGSGSSVGSVSTGSPTGQLTGFDPGAIASGATGGLTDIFGLFDKLGIGPSSVAKDFFAILFEGQTPGQVVIRGLEIVGGALLMSAGFVVLIGVMVGPSAERAAGNVASGITGAGAITSARKATQVKSQRQETQLHREYARQADIARSQTSKDRRVIIQQSSSVPFQDLGDVKPISRKESLR